VSAPVTTPAPRRLLLEVALLLPALAAGAGLSRLTDAPGAARVIAPVVLCVVAGELGAAVVRRLGAILSALSGVLVVALVSAWWFEPATTAWGLPTAATVRGIGHLLSIAVTITVHSPTPLQPAPGVVLCLAAGAGAAAVVGRALAPAAPPRAGRARMWLALVPSAGLFCYTALLNSGTDRALGAGIYLAAVLLYVLAVSRLSAPASSVATVSFWRRRRPSPRGWSAAGVSLVAALAAAAGVSPALAGFRVHAFPSSGPGLGSAAAGAFTGSLGNGVSLVDDLSSVVGQLPNTVLFTVQTPVPTYWQVTTLSSFNGSVWDPESATLLAADGVTPAPASSLPELPGPKASTTTFTSSVTVAKLAGTLAPVPPGVVRVRGDGMHVLRGIGIYDPAGMQPGKTYAAVSAAPLPVSGAARPGPSDRQLAPYLALPSVPADVAALAHAVAGGVADPGTRALRLAQFFDDGAFRYSLTTDNGDVSSLETFLFGTRAGACQQFAGAYAVLARLVGLPTRVAVGFDAGRRVGPDRFVITRADAHTWPEVYLGPGSGWVSFEPTPATGSTVTATGVVYGQPSGPGAQPAPQRDPSSEFPLKHLGGPAGVAPSALPASTTSSRAAANGPSRSVSWKGITLWVIVAIVVALAAFFWRRRIGDAVHAVQARRMAPADQVVARWHQATRALDRCGAGREPAETVLQHAERMGRRSAPGARCYHDLAHLASRALYSCEPVSATDAQTALRLWTAVRRETRRRVTPARHHRRDLVVLDRGRGGGDAP
jgi:transglutaminase-like putative cysteine protease